MAPCPIVPQSTPGASALQPHSGPPKAAARTSTGVGIPDRCTVLSGSANIRLDIALTLECPAPTLSPIRLHQHANQLDAA